MDKVTKNEKVHWGHQLNCTKGSAPQNLLPFRIQGTVIIEAYAVQIKGEKITFVAKGLHWYAAHKTAKRKMWQETTKNF